MTPVTIEITLLDACIETTVRREYRRRLSEHLRDEAPANGGEQELELLAAFLGETDFRRIRAGDPTLAGGTGVRVRLFWDEDGHPDFLKL